MVAQLGREGQWRGGVIFPTHSQPGARRRWVVIIKLRLLYPLERPCTYCTGGWLGLKGPSGPQGKFRHHRNSNPGPSSPQLAYSILAARVLSQWLKQTCVLRNDWSRGYKRDVACSVIPTELWRNSLLTAELGFLYLRFSFVFIP
jgi:hypothetical protein